MTVVWASVIAVLGTLGGVIFSYKLQEGSTKRAELHARSERLRQERLAAYSTFAGAVMDLRGAQYERAYSRMPEDGHVSDRPRVIAESSRLRSVAWTAFYRFKLTSPDRQLTDLAAQAVQAALDVADANDREDLKDRSERARSRIERFTSTAAAQRHTSGLEPRPRRRGASPMMGAWSRPSPAR